VLVRFLDHSSNECVTFQISSLFQKKGSVLNRTKSNSSKTFEVYILIKNWFNKTQKSIISYTRSSMYKEYFYKKNSSLFSI
jgi:CRISPR/Cas system-associated protein Cas10 (large subunit of type III CRISPR-Cas system)